MQSSTPVQLRIPGLVPRYFRRQGIQQGGRFGDLYKDDTAFLERMRLSKKGRERLSQILHMSVYQPMALSLAVWSSHPEESFKEIKQAYLGMSQILYAILEDPREGRNAMNPNVKISRSQSYSPGGSKLWYGSWHSSSSSSHSIHPMDFERPRQGKQKGKRSRSGSSSKSSSSSSRKRKEKRMRITTLFGDLGM